MYQTKYLKYKIKYLNLLIKDGGGNVGDDSKDTVNISCKINKNKQMNIKDEKYKGYNAYECYEQNVYLNKLKDDLKKDEKIKKIWKDDSDTLLKDIRELKIDKNVLKKQINIGKKREDDIQKKNNVFQQRIEECKNKQEKLNNKLTKKIKECDELEKNLKQKF